jgi:hypothetical protein
MTMIPNVLRSAKREAEEQRDVLDIFREFIACLDRAARGRGGKPAKLKERSGK